MVSCRDKKKGARLVTFSFTSLMVLPPICRTTSWALALAGSRVHLLVTGVETGTLLKKHTSWYDVNVNMISE